MEGWEFSLHQCQSMPWTYSSAWRCVIFNLLHSKWNYLVFLTTSGVDPRSSSDPIYLGNNPNKKTTKCHHIFWKTSILSSKLHGSIAAVVSGEKTSGTSKWDSWSQLKCNLSNPVIWRSKGFPLSVFSQTSLLRPGVGVCVCVCM